MKYIFLTIANFNIKVIFTADTLQHSLVNDILSHYSDYINKINSVKKDFIITIKHKTVNTVSFIPDNGSPSIHFFTRIYEKTGRSTCTTYSYINIQQFNHILFRIIEKLLIQNKGFLLGAESSVASDKVILIVGNRNKKTIVFIKKVKKAFYYFPNPFDTDKLRSNYYPISKVIFANKSTKIDTLEEIKDKNKYLNTLIKYSNFSKLFSDEIDYSADRLKSIQTIFSFSEKINFWRYKKN